MEVKRRSPILALALSFITPGLGQIYNGQLRKGVAFYFALTFLVAVSIGVLLRSFYGMVIAMALIICFFLFILIEALYSSRKLKQITLKAYNRWYIYIIIALVSGFGISPLVSATIKNNLFRAYKIPSGAMQPTLLIGDHIIADMRYPGNNKPQRGDIIIFKYPVDPSKDFINRIIGLPGEQVEIIDEQIYINGKRYNDRHGSYIGNHSKSRDKFGPVTVPDNHFFVLGDNRDHSYDSRFWGFVPLESIRGKALYIYWAKNKNRIGTELE